MEHFQQFIRRTPLKRCFLVRHYYHQNHCVHKPNSACVCVCVLPILYLFIPLNYDSSTLTVIYRDQIGRQFEQYTLFLRFHTEGQNMIFFQRVRKSISNGNVQWKKHVHILEWSV